MSGGSIRFTPFSDAGETLKITPDFVVAVGLEEWASRFKLGTAGYRDLLDPDDMHNSEVPFNSVTVAIMLEARARLASEEGLATLHVGGEVRPHTQEFIDLAARIYAAHGIVVRLRPSTYPTTPIWLSSFGVFYEELDGGENFTASHSPSFKGGWKPMEAGGGQILELAGRIAERVRDLVREAAGEGLTIKLAGSGDRHIRRDFDPIAPYVEVLRRVVPEDLLGEVPRAAAGGFRAAFCTEGGSMAATGRRILSALGLEVGPEAPLFFTHAQESSSYHGIGILDGVNHGVDPGKWQVYKHIGAQEILRRREADVFFIWDPDGDRFNMVTTAPATLAESAAAAGLEVDPLDDDRCLVFFKPNQIYFMLTALKLDSLRSAGELGEYDWIVATTYPTTRSIGELASNFNALHGTKIATFQTPVGFKYFAALVRDLEAQVAAAGDDRAGEGATAATEVTGETTVFGPRPRLLIMAEESGGATMGPAAPMVSRHGNRSALAAKEKDGMQIGVVALTLAARLHNDGGSFASYYLEQLEKYRIGYRFYERRDVTLFDEALQGEERSRAQAVGNSRKETTVAFFASLRDVDTAEATDLLRERLPAAAELPPVERIFHAGDGTLIEFAQQWFELRASGTDAVLRYYMEGRDGPSVSRLNEAMTELTIDVAESDAMAAKPYETLTVYSATWCPDCRQAKRFLDENGVVYDLIEIDHDEQAAVRLETETGKRGIPYFVLDGERWVRAYIPKQGFDREGMKKLLGLG